MNTSAAKRHEPVAVDVGFSATSMQVRLVDGREIRVPLAWFPKLLRATPAQRKNWRLIGKGVGIHWSSVDEDLSVAALFDH